MKRHLADNAPIRRRVPPVVEEQEIAYALFEARVPATRLSCACQRRGGRSHAQKKQKATLPQDRSEAPRSGSRKVRGTQQPHFSSFEEKLQVRNGAVHHLVLL